MAIKRLEKSFSPNVKEIKYLSKTFPQFRQNLIDFSKVYFPDTYNDFNESSPGMLFIEMASYIGDVLSYYIDTQFRENLIQYAEEEDNIISIAQSLGYVPKPATAAAGTVELYQLCPAGDLTQNYAPDSRYFLRLNAGATVKSTTAGSPTFRTVDTVDFSNPVDREITVYSIDANNHPVTYLITKKARVVAGEIKTYDATFSSPQKFSKVTLPDSNILEIIKVVDSNGNTWNQVDYLAQDLILDATVLSTPYSGSDESTYPTYMLNPRRTPRRFTVRYNESFLCELHFGSGLINDYDTAINLNPDSIANTQYSLTLASTPLDPSDFLSSTSYGTAPANTTLTVTYTIGGGIESNAPSNTITVIDGVTILNDPVGFTPAQRALYNDVVSSLAVNNSQPMVGGRGKDSVEEIRQNALAFFNAQNRVVTADDYLVRCYAMPSKFGGVSKAFVARDEQINNILRTTNQFAPQGGEFVENPATPNLINLYVLGYNQNKKLVKLNRDVKKNLRRYLETYRIMTDEVKILDAFVVNIGVNFRIVVFKNFNVNEVVARSIDAVKTFFDIDRWQINQPIVLNDLYTQIASVEGVQSVMDVSIVNKYGYRDGSDYESFIYDIPAATTNGIVYGSLDPCIFEVRYPETDIVASAIQ